MSWLEYKEIAATDGHCLSMTLRGDRIYRFPSPLAGPHKRITPPTPACHGDTSGTILKQWGHVE